VSDRPYSPRVPEELTEGKLDMRWERGHISQPQWPVTILRRPTPSRLPSQGWPPVRTQRRLSGNLWSIKPQVADPRRLAVLMADRHRSAVQMQP
jgi:hypothetical protein